jgi:hypothetical protein
MAEVMIKEGKNWEVTISEFGTNGNKIYKVTRRIAELKVAETKMFKTKEKATSQFWEWLD